MNLFRVRIEAATGGAAGEPEAVTTSAGSLGWSRFSNDGRRLVAQVYELSTVLELYQLATGPTASVRAIRTLRSRSLQWCSISPDAEWLACSTIGTPEDLVLLRADGSELRRLTDDVFKDRDIAWSPDGSRLQFQSTRSGSWTFWSLRADGSELRQLIDLGPDRYASIAAWRPDGRGVTFRADDRHLATIDATRLTRRSELQLTPLPSSIASFTASAWSPSGALLGGAETDVTQLALSVGAIDPERAVYVGSRLPAGGRGLQGVRRLAARLPSLRRQGRRPDRSGRRRDRRVPTAAAGRRGSLHLRLVERRWRNTPRRDSESRRRHLAAREQAGSGSPGVERRSLIAGL